MTQSHNVFLPKANFRTERPITSIALSPDGNLLAASFGQILRLWDLQNVHGLPKINFVGHSKSEATSLIWSSHGLFATYSTGNIAILSLLNQTSVRLKLAAMEFRLAHL